MKLQTTKNKENILKAAEEQRKASLRSMTIRLTADFHQSKGKVRSTKFLAQQTT